MSEEIIEKNDSDTLTVNQISHNSDDNFNYDKLSISSHNRLNNMLKEAQEELIRLQPEIEALETQLLKLQNLKQTKQKLITLKLSIESIINNFSNSVNTKLLIHEKEFSFISKKNLNDEKTKLKLKLSGTTKQQQKKALSQEFNPAAFYPDQAFEQAGEILKQKGSTNFELFRAIVFSGGRASTQQIKQYLVDHQITLPKSGEGFSEVPLTDISARVNYLIRKGLVAPDGRGYFRSLLGWAADDDE